jgi:hypothetical protein
MEPRVILYIIIGIIYLFVQYSRAKKKRDEQAQRGQGGNTADTNRPIQPPTPQKDKDTFREIYDRAQQKIEDRRKPKQQKKAEPKPQFAPPPRREYELVKPMREEIDTNYQDTSMNDMIVYEQPRELRTTVAAATVNYEEDVTNPILDNFDLRKALIAQIILERPEF